MRWRAGRDPGDDDDPGIRAAGSLRAGRGGDAGVLRWRANGNQTSNRVPDGQSFSQVDDTGEQFQFNVPAFIASLECDPDVAPPAARRALRRHAARRRHQRRHAGRRLPRLLHLQATQTRSVRILLR
jgi:hypothetical protein